MDNLSRSMFDDHKYVEWFEKDSVNRGEVTGPDFMDMVLENGAPVLPSRSLSDLFDVFPDGALVHYNL